MRSILIIPAVLICATALASAPESRLTIQPGRLVLEIDIGEGDAGHLRWNFAEMHEFLTGIKRLQGDA
jgi:hypothetical protein